jgi:hypothetical protein
VLCGVAAATVAFGQPSPLPVQYGQTAPTVVPIFHVPEPAPVPVSTGTAPAPAAGGSHKMEIYEGPNRTVAYFGSSPGDQAMLNDLARAENEMEYVNSLQALKRQYVFSERLFEPMRRYVQEQLYGTSISFGRYDAGYSAGGYGPAGYYYPYAYGGYGYPGMSASLGSGWTSVTRNLGYGVGDEGRLKEHCSQVIAQQMLSPEYAREVTRNYSAALDRVASSDRLAKDLGIRREVGAAGPPDVPPVKATLTLKNGDKVEGKMSERDDWYVIDTGKGVTRVRKSEVTRIDQEK